MNPASRTALITGGSRGIGRGIALELARLGCDLLINFARDESAARSSAEACVKAAASAGHVIRAFTQQGDIGTRAGREALIARARDVFDRLDLLVNNAGVAPTVRGDLLELTEESFERLMRINVQGPLFLSQLAARWMLETAGPAGFDASARGAPKIVNISSLSAYTASVNRGEYCVSKAALSMVTALFAARLAESGIRVYEIRPGIIQTDMTAGVRDRYDPMIQGGLTPIRRWGTPGDVGKAVAAIAGDLLPFSTGEVLNVDGGFHLRTL